MSFEIITDSSCDLSSEELQALNIRQVCFYISFDGENYLKEKQDMDTTSFYDKMKAEHAFPKTSLPSVSDYIEAFTPAAEAGRPVLCICISSKFSGSFQSARNAREIVKELHPKAHIYILDSALCTAAHGLLVTEAARMRFGGLSFKETCLRLKAIRETGRICFTVGNLEYLKHGGRIGKIAYIAGSKLGICPLIVMKEGEIFSGGIARNKKKAIQKLMDTARDYFEKANENPNDYVFCVGTGTEYDEAASVANQLQNAFWLDKPVPVRQIGATIGTHTGPFPLGFGFIKKYDRIDIS